MRRWRKRSASMSTATWQFRCQPARPRDRRTYGSVRFGTGIDDHAAVLCVEQAAVDYVSERDGVVHGRPVPKILALVAAGVEPVEVGNQLASLAGGGSGSAWAAVMSAWCVTSSQTH